MTFTDVFKALGDETRLRLINLFVQSGERICVCEMTDALCLPQHKVSKHLAILRNVDMVETEREGTWIYYKVNPNPTKCVADLLDVIKKHFANRYTEDIRKLNERFSKRENGYCVLGYSIYEYKHSKNKK